MPLVMPLLAPICSLRFYAGGCIRAPVCVIQSSNQVACKDSDAHKRLNIRLRVSSFSWLSCIRGEIIAQFVPVTSAYTARVTYSLDL